MPVALQVETSRIYLVGDTYPIKDRIKAMGGHWDGDRKAWWVGKAKAAEAQALVSASAVPVDPNAPKPKENPDNIRLTGKGRYRGREYFAGSITRDGTKVRLLTLPDANGDFLDFWALRSEVEQTKIYKPRERWNGRRGSNGTITVYTTLGSISDFVKDQKQAKAEGAEQCYVCGKRSHNLVHDLETGGMACRGCADMPAD
jgi:hypothetical protein